MKLHLFIGLILLWSQATGNAQVYRCGNTYSHVPCSGGKAIDTSPQLSDPRGPATTVIYLCRAPQGLLYWIQEPCSSRGWSIERTARVPNNVSWDDQVEAGRAQKQAAKQLNEAPSTYTVPSPQQSSSVNSKSACLALDERVKSLDSMGRAGSQYYDLDWVRRERKSARDQQFRLRCR